MILSKNILRNPSKPKGIDFNDKEINEVRKNKRMLMLMLEFSNICDLCCIYCLSTAGKPLPNELKLEEYKNILDQAKKLGAKTIFVPGSGEPTIDPNFWPVINYIAKKGMNTVLFTHGAHLTRAICEKLFKKKVTLGIKINSFKPSIQDWLAGVKGYTKKRDRGLKYAMEAGFNKTEPTRLWLDSLVCKQNYNEIPSLFRWARKNNIWPGINTFYHRKRGAGKEVRSKLDVSIEEIKNLWLRLLEIDQKEFGYTWIPAPPYVAWHCNFYYYTMRIDVQGNATKCLGFDIPVGNIRKKTLKELWHHPLIKKATNIDKHLKGVCAACKAQCYGCPCRRYLETHKISSIFESKSCWADNIGESPDRHEFT